MRVPVTLEDAAPAVLELLDVAGRRVERREIGELGAGTHVVTFDRMDRLPAGVYHVRLVSGMRVAQARVSILR